MAGNSPLGDGKSGASGNDKGSKSSMPANGDWTDQKLPRSTGGAPAKGDWTAVKKEQPKSSPEARVGKDGFPSPAGETAASANKAPARGDFVHPLGSEKKPYKLKG